MCLFATELTPRVDTVCVQSIMAKTVGERIRQARQARKWSGEHLAQLAGYKQQSAIGNLENRATGQGGNKLPAIAAALKVPLTWLLEGPDSDVVPFFDDPGSAQIAAEPLATYGPPFAFADLLPDPWIDEAVRTLSKLSAEDRRAAVLCLRAFVHHLLTPGDGQALPVAA
jgi:transcriptional regulator with XRE-family HTH domain